MILSRSQKSLNSILDSAIIVLLLFISCGFVVLNDYISSAMTIVLWILTIILICWNEKPKVGLNELIFLLLLFSVILISDILNAENLRTTFCNWVAILTSFLFVSTRSFERFKKSYICATKFLCITSLVGFFLFLIFPNLNNIAKNGARNFNCLYIFVHCADSSLSESTRNFGMFWEPGAYQTFINLALFFEMSGKKVSKMNVVIFIVTLITTFSTTGYIAMCLILVYPFLDTNKNNKAKRRIVFFLVFGFVIFVLKNLDLFFSTTRYTVFGKITGFFNGSELSSGKVTSATIRYYSVVKPIEAFLNKPFWGLGDEGLKKATYEYTFTMNTCTFVNWFAIHGVFYGILMFLGTYKFSRFVSTSNVKLVLTFLLLFIITCSENYVDNASIMLLIFYGIFNKQIMG